MRSIATEFLLSVGAFAVLFSALVVYQTYSATRAQIMELHDQLATLAVGILWWTTYPCEPMSMDECSLSRPGGIQVDQHLTGPRRIPWSHIIPLR